MSLKIESVMKYKVWMSHRELLLSGERINLQNSVLVSLKIESVINYKDLNITSTTCINEANRINEDATVSLPLVSPEPGNSNDDGKVKFFHEGVVPSTSMENANSIVPHSNLRKKRKSNSTDESSPEKKNKIDEEATTTDIPVIELTECQRKYKSTLLEMFPDVDPEYLNQRCSKLDNDLAVHEVISDMLQNDYPLRQAQDAEMVEAGAEPQPGPSVPISLEEKIEAQYKTLVAILPNADPTYLHEQCEAMAGNEEDMKNFVSDALENERYPTRETYLRRQEVLALQKKYTEQFSIEEFLESIPDPFKYFNEEKKNEVKISNYALPFLKSRYRKIRKQDLLSVLQKHHYSLTRSCEELDRYCGRTRKSRRPEYECQIPTEVNIPFLQEVGIFYFILE